MDRVSDVTMRAVEYALEGAHIREQMHAHNVANSAVPDYRARAVDFEGQLRMAIETNDATRIDPVSTRDSGGVPNYQGNTVRLEEEMTGLLKNNLVQDAMVAAYNFKTTVLRTAVGR